MDMGIGGDPQPAPSSQGMWGADAQLRTTASVQPPRRMRAPGFEWEHEIRVALPPSYAHSEAQYPVLWVTDNNLEIALWSVDRLARFADVPEMIVVAIGADQTVPFVEWETRRLYEYTSSSDFYYPGPTGDSMRELYKTLLPGWEESTGTGGAARFLDFLVDDVRPALAAQYRFDPHEHALIGNAGGALFGAFAMFARPDAFNKHILGSLSLNIGAHRVFELEQRYAAEHADLPVHVFVGAGELEMTEHLMASVGCLGATVRFVETLTVRRYPSLKLTAKIFPDVSHLMAVGPLYDFGLRAVWADRAAEEPQDPAKGTAG